jgi:GT2 family glycosyltransferase
MSSTPMITAHLIVHQDFSHIYDALRSLIENTHIPMQVVVTVNAGSIEDTEQLQHTFPNVHVKMNQQAHGFAANHNAVLRLANTPYVVLLNDDVVVQSNALDTLVAYLENHPEAGLVGPLIVNPDGSPQQSAFSDPSLFRMLYKISGLGHLTAHGSIVRRLVLQVGLVNAASFQTTSGDVPVIVGVCMVVRRSAYQMAGVMDEDTLVYAEEFGWQWRLRKQGWRVVLVSEARITHFNPQQELTGWRLAEHRKGILNYYLRYRSHWQALMIRAGIVFFHTLWAVLNMPFRHSEAHSHWLAVRVGLMYAKPIR